MRFSAADGMSVENVLTQNIRHLVLEVLSGNKRVQQLPALIDHSVDLSTAASKVRVIVESILI